MQLHVADGSQVVSRRVDGSRLTVFVGTRGKERYGSCPSRLDDAAPRPGLPADPRDRLHRRRRRPLPAGVVRGADPADPRARQLHPADGRPERDPCRRRRASASRLRYACTGSGTSCGTGGARACSSARNLRFDGRSLVYDRAPAAARSTLAWLDRAEPDAAGPARTSVTYEHARASVEDYWAKRLETGARARRPGAARLRRRAQPADPEPAACRGATASATPTSTSPGSCSTWAR